MKRKFHTPEQIVKKLREADAAVASGSTVEQVCKQLGISDATYYNWKSRYAGLTVSELKRLKAMEEENRRLKLIVAEQALDIRALKELLSKNF